MWQQIIWDEEPGGNVEHIEEHGLTVNDVEQVLANPEAKPLAIRRDCLVLLATRRREGMSLWCMKGLMMTLSIRRG